MKAKKLLMMLSTMAAMVAGSSAKAEKVNFPMQQGDAKDILFNQTEVARFPVPGTEAYVSLVKGWQAGTKVAQTPVSIVNGQVQYETTTNRVDVSEADTLWTAPFVVHGKEGDSGFATARTDSEIGFMTNGISTVTVNPDNGKMYVFENHDQSHDHFWEFSLGNITGKEPLEILGQLNPQATEVPFYSDNSDSGKKQATRVDKAFAWGQHNVGDGEWIVTYDSQNALNNTIVWHRNGVVNRQAKFVGIKPEEVTFTEDKIYVSDGTNLVSMDKANPTNGYTTVELSTGNQGFGVTSTGIYQVNADGQICNEAGRPMNLYKKIAEDTAGIEWGPYENKGAFTDMMVDDQGRLITAFSADAEVDVKDLYIGEAKHPMKAISGVQKIVSAQNGVIQALTKSGTTIQRTYGE